MDIAIIGGGPSGLFMLKKLIEQRKQDWNISIFEKDHTLGSGMPYSKKGALEEHVTNVSGNEIPELVTSVADWIPTVDQGTLNRFSIDPANFHEYKVLPRLLFGMYLHAQFKLLLESAKMGGISVSVKSGKEVTDIGDDPENGKSLVHVNGQILPFDKVVVCTGHYWPKNNEDHAAGYFDSPYPPSKLKIQANHPVAIKGASLTSIDAIKTLARENGVFHQKENGQLIYKRNESSPDFKIVLHSLDGLLPALRFHLEEPEIGKDALISPEDIAANRAANDGFLSLDYVFECSFKSLLRENDPVFYEKIRDMNIETFVKHVMDLREKVSPFELFRAEYEEARKSIKKRESVYWKEALAILSYSMNYPAKHFSAEDMLRLQKTLKPLISLVIAFVPQSSAEELMALHNAGVLEIQSVDKTSRVEKLEKGGVQYIFKDENGEETTKEYPVFINSIGQPPLNFEDFPYEGMRKAGVISPAKLKFRSKEQALKLLEEGNKLVEKDETGNYYLRVPGIAINDHFQVLDKFNACNERIYIMAVPFIGGYNPDYSGLDFCETASGIIAKSMAASAV